VGCAGTLRFLATFCASSLVRVGRRRPTWLPEMTTPRDVVNVYI
jgi:hypothetical protein